jgi:hypothetical protein
MFGPRKIWQPWLVGEIRAKNKLINEHSPTAATGYGPNDKRRKPLQLSSMTYILDDSDILDDLKIINKNKAFSVRGLAASCF